MNIKYLILSALVLWAFSAQGQCCDTVSEGNVPTQSAKKKVRVLLAGDSTMQDVDHKRNPDWGWGQVFPRYFNDNVEIINLAKGGRSTRSFTEEGRWDDLISQTGEGDYVFIQFGHNDGAKDKPERYTTPDDYRKFLTKFVTETRDKGAIPILLTPVMRRNFDDEGRFFDTHGPYPAIVKEVAGKMKVMMIDFQEKSKHVIINHGVEGSRVIFMNVAPGEHICCPDGRRDNTHFSEYGAMQMSAEIIKGIKEQNILPLEENLL